MSSYVAPLEEVDLEDIRKVGGKAANLGRLAAAGFPVPPGFCILAEAFDAFIAFNDLERDLAEAARALDFEDPEILEKQAAGMRALIVSGAMPPEIEGEIHSAYSVLTEKSGSDLVAVRSSVGTTDLSATSFPGQMDTYHNVRGAPEVTGRVKECWASRFSYGALVSRRVSGIDHSDVFVAPVVQAMVEADCAGVVFTANPLNGRRDQMVINSCYGLGEGVVSGEIACDHFVVDSSTGRVLEARPGESDSKIVLDTRGSGNAKVPLSPEEKGTPSLSEEMIREIVDAACRIEDMYGAPQDIEWAFAGGKLFILQSRAVTALGRPGEGPGEWVSEFDTTVDPRYPYYTLSNISEVLPGVLTPLTLSGIGTLDYGFTKTNTDFGLMKDIKPESEYNFLGIFYNRAHLNLSVVKAVTAKLPGASAQEFERMKPRGDERWREEAFKPTPGALLGLVSPLCRILYKALTTERSAKEVDKTLEERISRAKGIDFESLPYDEFLLWLDRNWDLRRRIITLHITASQFAVVFYDFLLKITEKWLGDREGVLASTLVTGLQEIESALPSIHIWDLSRMVAESEELSRLFDRHKSDELPAALARLDSEDSRRFQEGLSLFLERFGYRSVLEAELMLPNWEDDASYIFTMMKNYLVADPSLEPREMLRRQERERHSTLEVALGRLKGPKRILFNLVLRQAQRYITLREFMKGVLIRGIALIKKQYHVLSRRLTADGTLDEPSDLFFLALDEVGSLLKGEAVDVRSLVTRRRFEYERNKTVVLPEYSHGRPRPLPAEEVEPQRDLEVLTGIAVSPGTVTGRARVITDPRAAAEILPGEILVAPVTDAAWTPLFVTAGGIVVDVGGPLSHGSIVAREYGIPGVLNVGIATRMIETGQLITVDGSNGRVYLHPV